MCGIVGYIGREEAAPILLYGLSRLEYRGYDSAGISVYNNGCLNTVKAVGKLQNLIDLTDSGKNVPGCVGIGHTRWATHGQPSDINSHPHVSASGKISVVHNGIIENYLELKEMLISEGVQFKSETDTEVVSQLIDYYYNGDLMDAVSRALAKLEGSYALVIISSEQPDVIIAARKDAPLIVAYGDGCNYIASDVAAVLKYTRQVSYLEDDEIAVVKADSVTVYNEYGKPIDKAVTTVEWDIEDAQKGGYPHFMIKEIHEQPKVIRNTISAHIKDGRVDLSDTILSEEFCRDIRRICIIGCGSANHVGVVGRYLLEKYTRIPTEAVLASEFRYSEPIVDEHSLIIVISQSGETADTIAAMREAKRLGAKTLAIVNVVGSTIAKEADCVLYTLAGPEIAVATTKAYSAQLAVMYLVTIAIADKLGRLDAAEHDEIVRELCLLPEKVEHILADKEKLQQYASQYFNNESIFFIGRNLDYAISLEGSLKLKEISYIHSEAYAGGELKHGTISLIEPKTLVIAVATYEKLFDKLMSNVKEVTARGANVLCVAQQHNSGSATDAVNNAFFIPDTHEMLTPSLAAIPLQLFAYYVALSRGCDIDKPRNLAKSVTVE
ncbi:MAG: glutamine--fructose-6-phosphate transaminase (isomerizing) [Clostridiales bacterium]|nr:glutamine--fructose-6-phosphate transaminase (isomerizing) [Clostridiales bacterium]